MLTSGDIPFSKMLHIVFFSIYPVGTLQILACYHKKKIKTSTKADTWWHTNAPPFST